MRIIGFSVLPLVLVCWVAIASATDLSKIDRIIKKEPAYKGKPEYCLLVFGAEARTTVWLVLDGDVLYVDRNGNGDVSEPGERIRPTRFREVVMSERQDPPPLERDFEIGDVVEVDSDSKHRNLKVNHCRWGDKDRFVASILVNGKYGQVAGIPFGGKVAQAPIVWFNGPLTMKLHGDPEYLSRNRGATLSCAIGTRGLGTFAVISYDAIPANVFPLAEFEFPSQDPEGAPLRARVALDHRC